MSTMPSYKFVSIEDSSTASKLKIFYREAGDPASPSILLLHGFPTSGHQYRGLISRLADKYHVVAPDLPGFGFSDAPPASQFKYTFDHLAEVIGRFVSAIDLQRYAIYVFDYGAPVGFRLAASSPDRVIALISQNGNAYEEGLSDAWNPIRAYWENPSEENRSALRVMLKSETTFFQYTHGETDTSLLAPESYTLDQFFLDRPGSDDIQLDLFGDYKTNVAAYPRFHEYFRKAAPPTLAVWGQNDPFFLPAGAEAFKRDNPKAEVYFINGGHFPLETHLDEAATVIRSFLARVVDQSKGEALFGRLSEQTVPSDASAHLKTMSAIFGFVPNLALSLAVEPAVLGAYISMLGALSTTSLSPIAQQVALVAASRVNEADYGIAVHSTLAGKVGGSEELVSSLRKGGALDDPQLEAVRRFASAIAANRTQVSDSDVVALKIAGLDHKAAVAIAFAVASKTLANAVAHLSLPEIDSEFQDTH